MAMAKLTLNISNTVLDQLVAYRNRHGDDAFVKDVKQALDEDRPLVMIRQVGQEGGCLHFEAVPSPFLSGLVAAHGVTL
jgi:hypothetical protein